jgi:hypothetical protein
MQARFTDVVAFLALEEEVCLHAVSNAGKLSMAAGRRFTHVAAIRPTKTFYLFTKPMAVRYIYPV